MGHALGAVAAGCLAAGAAPWGRPLLTQLGLLAALGVAPDLDLLIGRHSRETHSLGAAVIVASFVAWQRWPVAGTRARIWAAACLAWLSHPLLDALSFDWSIPQGVMLAWPFSTHHVQTGLALFDPIVREYWEPWFVSHNVRAVVKECVLLGPLALVVAWRRRARVSGTSAAR